MLPPDPSRLLEDKAVIIHKTALSCKICLFYHISRRIETESENSPADCFPYGKETLLTFPENALTVQDWRNGQGQCLMLL